MKLFETGFTPSLKQHHAWILSGYFILSWIGICHHELWLDEAHHFLLARDSSSIHQLFFNARYDGHPLLWNILLWIITRWTHDPFFMQLLHILVSTAALAVFLRNAPFPDFFKLMFACGYFVLYEYNVISRNYALSMLLLFLATSFLTSGKRNSYLLFLMLILLAYTHLFSLICSLSLFCFDGIRMFRDKQNPWQQRSYLLLTSLYLLCVAVILVSIMPPQDHFLRLLETDPLVSVKRIGKAGSACLKGFFHVPDITEYHSWNTHWLVDYSKPVAALMSVTCIMIPFFCLYNKPRSLLVFYSGAAAIILFLYVSPIIAGVRYFGFIFLLFIVSLWLSFYEQHSEKGLGRWMNTPVKNIAKKFSLPVVWIMMIVQCASGIWMYVKDLRFPFSESKNLSLWIQKNFPGVHIVALSNQSTGPPVSAYLDCKLFYPETNRFGSFCLWNTHPFMITRDTLLQRINRINADSFLLVLNDSIFSDPGIMQERVFENEDMKIYFLAKFENGIVRSENYRTYKVTHKRIGIKR